MAKFVVLIQKDLMLNEYLIHKYLFWNHLLLIRLFQIFMEIALKNCYGLQQKSHFSF